MRFLNLTPFPFGFKSCSRKPPQPEMTAVVRAKLVLAPGQPMTPARGTHLDEETIAAFAEGEDDVGADAERAMGILGQGSLTAARHHDDDDRLQGEVLLPSDFADFKLSADVMLRGTCYPRKETSACIVTWSVGDWQKSLKVVGTRVLVDRVAGGKATLPKPFRHMAVDYAHAYGGPGFADNPIGKGHLGASARAIEDDLYQPPRSERSAVMAASQLPNVVYTDDEATRRGLPAGFGPLNAMWAHRSKKLGTRYDAAWRKERAPYQPVDFDWTHFNAAPPDQILDGYLRGDETLSFTNLHPAASQFSATLPGLRIRVFVLTAGGDVREVAMSLDTLFADLDDDALYLTWRGLTPAADPELSDLAFALVASEMLGEAAQPASDYAERLRAFAADPAGIGELTPEGLAEAADTLEALEDADDEALDRFLESDDEDNPMSALLSHMGPLAGGGLERTRDGVGRATDAIPPDALKAEVKQALKKGRASGGAQSPAAAAVKLRELGRGLDRVGGEVGEMQELDAARATIDASVAAAGAEREPLTGPSFAGQDLTGRDLRGQDLSGADFEGAVLDHADLEGALLIGARFASAQLYRTNLSGADMSGADLSHAILHRATLTGAVLRGALLEMTDLRRVGLGGACLAEAKGRLVTFSQCELEGVDAEAIAFEQASFERCTLAQARFADAALPGVRFRACQAPGLCLSGARLDSGGFKDSVLTGADARGVRGEQSVWQGSDLREADLSLAHLPKGLFLAVRAEKASFYGADLRDCRFDEARLDQASFEKANLHGACLRRASIARLSFAGASLYLAQVIHTTGRCDLSGARLEGAFFEGSEMQP